MFAGEPQYFFTNFVSAVTFVYELNDASRLSNITQKEFEIGMENSDVKQTQIDQPASNENFKNSSSESTNEDGKASTSDNNHFTNNGNHLNGSESNQMHSGSVDENLIDFESSIAPDQKSYIPSLSTSSNDQILDWMKENIHFESATSIDDLKIGDLENLFKEYILLCNKLRQMNMAE